MAAATCASNFRSVALQTDFLFTLHSKTHVIDSFRFKDLVKKLDFPVLRTVNKKQRSMVISMCSNNPQSGKSSTILSKEGVVNDVVEKEISFSESKDRLDLDIDGNSGGGGGFAGGGGGGGGGGGDGDGGDEEDKDEKEFGPILKFEEVMKETEERGVKLPLDMLEAAKTTGIRKLLLLRYLDLQGAGWGLGFLMRSCSMLRNRMLIDPSFLFKIGAEIVFDSVGATVAEVQKRGKDFWAEFELYASNLLVGVVVNIALVGMLAPYARIGVIGQTSVSTGFIGRFQHACRALPSSVFEAERSGCRYSVNQRIAAYFYNGVLYCSVGFACGIIGQGISNAIMTAKRHGKKSENDIPVPPLVKSAALWGVFLAVSSNTRYQIINALESLVEASPLVKRVPLISKAFTVGIRSANNVYGGMQFVDWARWSGVQ